MECRGYGPCEISGLGVAERRADQAFDAPKCDAVTAEDVLRRMCTHIAIDEKLYLDARARFKARLPPPAALQVRLQLLHEAGIALQRRADEQAATSKAWLQARSGACLLYTSPSPRDGLLSRMPSSA